MRIAIVATLAFGLGLSVGTLCAVREHVLPPPFVPQVDSRASEMPPGQFRILVRFPTGPDALSCGGLRVETNVVYKCQWLTPAEQEADARGRWLLTQR